MTTEKTNHDDLDFDELRHLLKCDNAKCGAMNPVHKCARCKSTYYCSVLCQQAHWTQSHKSICRPIETRRAEWMQQFALPSIDGAEVKVADDAVCGICLEDTIRHPFVLPKCKHVFCLKCIGDYAWMKTGRGDEKKQCPLCRTKIAHRPVDEALFKAGQYLKRALDFVPDDHIEEQDKMYRLAAAEVDKVLEVYPQDTDALLMRAKLLQRSDLPGAIKMFQKAFKVHRAGEAEFESLRSEMVAAVAIDVGGDADRASSMAHTVAGRIEQSQKWRNFIGMPGPRQLWSAHCDLAEAYEAAGRITDASKEYGETMESRGPDNLMCIPLCCHQGEDGPLTRILMGIARVCTRMDNFTMAIHTADHFATKHRSTCGVHKLLASALLAMAEKTKTPGTVVKTIMEGNKVKVSLDGAIEVIYKGFVYEEQWNDKNKKANRDFLQELLDKKAAKCTQGAKSKKDAKGSTTSAPAAANGDATAATGNANDTMAPAGNAAQAPRVVRGKKGRKNKKRAGK